MVVPKMLYNCLVNSLGKSWLTVDRVGGGNKCCKLELMFPLLGLLRYSCGQVDQKKKKAGLKAAMYGCISKVPSSRDSKFGTIRPSGLLTKKNRIKYETRSFQLYPGRYICRYLVCMWYVCSVLGPFDAVMQ